MIAAAIFRTVVLIREQFVPNKSLYLRKLKMKDFVPVI